MGNVVSALQIVQAVGSITATFLLPLLMELYSRMKGVRHPVPLPENLIRQTGKSPEQLRQEARATLGIDLQVFNFAVAGASGSGKSSLINGFLGMDDTDTDAAPVGETECTSKIAKYSNPDYPKIVLWDIPGGGTQRNSASSYFMDKKLYAFDTIIITGFARFTELDIAIAKDAKKYDVPLVFVRTKSDFDIDNRARRLKLPKKEVKHDMKNAILRDMRNQLPEDLSDQKMFVVSSRVFQGVDDGFNPADYALDEAELANQVLRNALNRRS